MEGPTPVSALIHAATMVVAGVYLVARMLPLFEVGATACRSSITVARADHSTARRAFIGPGADATSSAWSRTRR